MARPAIDISLFGDKELERKLARLGTFKSQRKAVRPAMRKSTKRLHAHVLQNLSGHPVTPQTGRLLIAMAGQKPKLLKSGGVSHGFDLPPRDDLGIDPNDPWFYPTHVEYGHGGPHPAPPHPYIRPAVDQNRDRELTQIGQDIGRGIVKQAMKK